MSSSAEAFAAAGQWWPVDDALERLDQDGPEPRDADLRRQPNELHAHTTRGGRMRFTGDIDAEAAALFTELLGPPAKREVVPFPSRSELGSRWTYRAT